MIIATPDDTPDLSNSTTGVTGFEVDNLLNYHTYRKYKVNAAGFSIVADFGLATARQLVMLAKTNMTDASTYRVTAAGTLGGLTSAPGYDSGVKSFDAQGYSSPDFIHWTPSPQSFRWWRVAITNTLPPTSAGRLYIVPAWESTQQVAPNFSLGILDDTVTKISRGGNMFARARPTRRTMNATLQYQSRADALEDLYRIKRQRGKSEDVFISIDPTHSRVQDLSIYGLMSELPPVSLQMLDLYQTRFRIDEEID